MSGLEEQLAAAARYSPEKTDQKLHQLEMQVREKDKIIACLQIQLEEQVKTSQISRPSYIIEQYMCIWDQKQKEVLKSRFDV